ncbi:MAG: hypothetical protein JWO12_3055 [Frankiales bacterium]|nr:hypothetical protein [Frankiales bacterium]
MRRVAAALALALMVTACGSTVQLKSTGTAATDDGLSPGTNQAGGGQDGQVPTTDGTGAVPPQSGSTQGLGSGATGGAGSTGSAQSTTGSGSAGAPTNGSGSLSSGRSNSASSGSIQLGFMTTNVGNAQALGVNAGQTYPDKAVYDALVKDVNSKGGLAGKKVTAVYGDTDTASSDWSTQFQAACSNLTQDHKVKAVIGYVFVFIDSFEQCLAKAHVPHLYGGYQPGDTAQQKQFPTLSSIAHPTTDGSYLAVLNGAVAAGRVTSKSKLGVFIDNCANGWSAFDRSAVPFLKSHQITYELVKTDCATGASDVSGAATAVKSAELQFSAHGVDTVFIGGVAMLLFMENAASQGYHPQYVTSVGGAALQANAPADQLKLMHGYGWLPAVDTDPQHQPYGRTSAQSACLAVLAKAGLVPKAYNDFMFAYLSCDGVNLYGQALAKTGGNTDPIAIQQAVLAIEPTFKGAATYGGALRSSSNQRGGAASFREYNWVTGCSCFQYQGPVRSMPAP